MCDIAVFKQATYHMVSGANHVHAVVFNILKCAFRHGTSRESYEATNCQKKKSIT